jgi:hypothetical protein
MKLSYLSAMPVLLFTAIAPQVMCQDNVTADRQTMHFERLTPQGNFVKFLAANIVSRASDRYGKIRMRLVFGSHSVSVQEQTLGAPGTILHLEGNVEITIFNRALMSHVSTRDELTEDVILTADQADYNVDTGEIQPEDHV